MEGAMEVKVGDVVRKAPLTDPTQFRIDTLGLRWDTLDRLQKPPWNERPEATGILINFSTAKTQKEEQNAVEKFTELAGKWFPFAVGGDTDVAILTPDHSLHGLNRRRSVRCLNLLLD